MTSWPSWTALVSITNGIIPPGRPMPTCGIARKGSMPFCEDISITKVRIGRATSFPAQILDRRRIGEDADLLHNGFGQEHGRDGGAGDAVCRRNCLLPM